LDGKRGIVPREKQGRSGTLPSAKKAIESDVLGGEKGNRKGGGGEPRIDEKDGIMIVIRNSERQTFAQGRIALSLGGTS